jgi:7,8-dihydropterin-6-yl-methyl-4-(beta-D-ribofuranosyl)aminobenzene 5'-phosphate synthase
MPALTILIDNTVRKRDLLAQHGFSAWCEWGACRILFDTGACGRILASNASVLGADLSTTTDIVLSHGHWDHGGGLATAMRLSDSAKLWIPAGALMPRWHRDESGLHDIALPLAVRETLVVERKRWTEVSGPLRIGEGVWLTGPIPGRRPEWTHRGLVRNEVMDIPDDVPEEQALVLETDEGLVAVAGCAHFGLDNLLDFLERDFPGRPLKALVGGLHLESAPKQELSRMADRLHGTGVRRVVPCHCSGPVATARLGTAKAFECEPGQVGKVLRF